VTWDEDAEPKRVGSLERDHPILLLTETLEHHDEASFGASRRKVHERKRGIGRAVAGGENTLEG
jgi:hypothetical protein